MKNRHYIAPSLVRIALPSATLMTALSIGGTESGEARSNEFWGAATFDQESKPEEEEPFFK